MKDLQFLKEKLIAHRGVCYNYLENTLDAFRMAIIKNYTIELDIHLTKDNANSFILTASGIEELS